jgi:transketolase
VVDGGYILRDTAGDPDVVLLATGSEVELAVMASDLLAEQGAKARVVSIPSWELFDIQPDEYRRSVLGPEGTPRVSIEAGVSTGWQKYTGSNGAQVSIDTYGASGPGKKVLEAYGFTREHVAATALRLLGRHEIAIELDKDFSSGQTAGTQPAGSEGHS